MNLTHLPPIGKLPMLRPTAFHEESAPLAAQLTPWEETWRVIA